MVLAVAALLLLPLAGPAAADGPAVRLSAARAGTGGSVTVHGTGRRPNTLLMLLVCGRATPSRGVIGGTNSCADADGRAEVFQLGTAHGVFAPQWDDQQWHGTLAPGRKARIELPVELSAGAPLGRDPLLAPALPGRTGRVVPRRDGGGGPGTATPPRRPRSA